MKEQRRSQRFRHELKVELHDRHGSKEAFAVDVARHGLFLATDEPPRERHLVQLTVHIPSGPIRAAGSVTRALKGQHDHEDGVGIQFFALSDDAKERWDAFIFQLQNTPPPPTSPPRAAGGGSTFLVKLKTAERLKEFAQTHLAAGGTVLFTPVLRGPGEMVTLIVVHPKTDEEFRLPGVIHKAHSDRPKRLEIHFHGITPALLNAFAAFAETGTPPRVQLEHPPEQKGSEQDLDLDVDVFDEDTLDTDEPMFSQAPTVDPGFKPSTFLLRCDKCDSLPYAIDLGPCRGVLGLVADHTAFMSSTTGRVVTVPRLAAQTERAERRAAFVKKGGRLDASVEVAMLLEAVALTDPPKDNHGALKSTRAVERLELAARRIGDGDPPARSRVSCAACKEGHLTVERVST